MPDSRSEATSELLFGELVQVLVQEAQWCKIRVLHDGYEGFVETANCDFSHSTTTHWVSTKATFVFEKPDIKSTVVQRLMFGSELKLRDFGEQRNWLKLPDVGFVWAAHCLALKVPLELSMVEIAQNNYLHAPYLWGGRSVDGCDCSGLVQMLAMATAISLPRDSGDQEAALFIDVNYENRGAEDLVYWPGHVGLLKSPDVLLHSTAHSMRCCIEPLQEVMQRAGAPSSIKRMSKH